ncbi:MAG: type II secretion system protein [Burkholderiales bacterium]|nr:type II secretion system protein [Burkholderiales bacterium]
MSPRTEFPSPLGAGRRSRGISLIELIVFIGIITVGIGGILGVMNYMTRASADPLAQKQALAIAEAYLEEVLAMPFTYCDPDDANAATAQSTDAVNPVDPTRCAATLEGMGAEGETRGSTTTPYDNVNDYSSLPTGAPASVDGTAIGGLSAYSVSVSVAAAALAGSSGTVAANDAFGRPQSLRVTVTVTGPGTTVVLDGYRTRYAPNALP